MWDFTIHPCECLQLVMSGNCDWWCQWGDGVFNWRSCWCSCQFPQFFHHSQFLHSTCHPMGPLLLLMNVLPSWLQSTYSISWSMNYSSLTASIGVCLLMIAVSIARLVMQLGMPPWIYQLSLPLGTVPEGYEHDRGSNAPCSSPGHLIWWWNPG